MIGVPITLPARSNHDMDSPHAELGALKLPNPIFPTFVRFAVFSLIPFVVFICLAYLAVFDMSSYRKDIVEKKLPNW